MNKNRYTTFLVELPLLRTGYGIHSAKAVSTLTLIQGDLYIEGAEGDVRIANRDWFSSIKI